MSEARKWLNLFPVPVAIINKDGRILAGSDLFAKIFLEESRVEEDKWELFDLPGLESGEGERILEYLDAALAGGEIKDFLTKVKTPDGLKAYSLMIKRVRWKGSEAYLINFLDRTERLMLQEELKEKRMAYYRLAEVSRVAGILYLTNGRVYFANPLVKEITGYSVGELKNLGLEALFPPGYRDEVSRILEKMAKENYSDIKLLKFTPKGGGERWAIFSFSSWVEKDGVAGAVMFFDVTERMDLMEDLQQYQLKFHATLSTLPDIYFEIDEKGKFVGYRSPEENDLLLPPEAFLGKHFREVLPYELAEMVESAIERIKKEGNATLVYGIEVKGVKKYYEARGTAAGKRIIFISRDITDRVRLENLLHAINNVNKLLLKRRSERALLDEVCSVLSENEDIECMWMGLLKEGRIELVSAHPPEVLRSLLEMWEGEEGKPCEEVWKAIQEEREVVLNREEERCNIFTKFWKIGKGSEIIVPMIHGGDVVGVMTIYMTSRRDAGDEEIELLKALANDIAHAIRDIEAERRLKAAYEQLKENLERFERIADRIRNPLMVAEGLSYLFQSGRKSPEEFHREIKKQLERIREFLERLRDEEVKSYLIKKSFEETKP